MKTFENLTPSQQELMELLGKQGIPEGQALQDIDTILKAELPQAGGEKLPGTYQKRRNIDEKSKISCFFRSAMV